MVTSNLVNKAMQSSPQRLHRETREPVWRSSKFRAEDAAKESIGDKGECAVASEGMDCPLAAVMREIVCLGGRERTAEQNWESWEVKKVPLALKSKMEKGWEAAETVKESC